MFQKLKNQILLKDDNHSIKKKDIETYLNKQEEVQIFKETKKNQI